MRKRSTIKSASNICRCFCPKEHPLGVLSLHGNILRRIAYKTMIFRGDIVRARRIAALLTVVLLLSACQTGLSKPEQEDNALEGYSLSEIGVSLNNLADILGEDAARTEVEEYSNSSELYDSYKTDFPYFSMKALRFNGSATSVYYDYSAEAEVIDHLGEGPHEPFHDIVTVKNPITLLQAYRKEDIQKGGVIEICYIDLNGETEERPFTINSANLYSYSLAEVNGYIIYDWLELYTGSFVGFLVENQLAQEQYMETRDYEMDYNPYIQKVPLIRTTLRDRLKELVSSK